MQNIKHQNGFAIMEVLIAVAIFAIGIMGVAALQYRAVNQNKVAYDRTKANAIALSVLEELKRLPFNDPNLVDTNVGANLFAGQAPAAGLPHNAALADQRFTAAGLPVLGAVYNVDAFGRIIDISGALYDVFWNVQPTTINIGATTFTPSLTIKLFIYWTNKLGTFHLEMTTEKYS